MTSRREVRASVLVLVASALLSTQPGPSAERQHEQRGGKEQARLAFVGLHGGVFDVLMQFAGELDLDLRYVTDRLIEEDQVDFAQFDIVFLQHVRREDRDHYITLLRAAKQRNPKLRVISISGLAERHLPELVKEGLLEHDPQLAAYYGPPRENLRRFLLYVSAQYLNRSVEVPPPLDSDMRGRLYHPDHEGLFETPAEFLEWAKRTGRDTEKAPRAVVAVHSTHLALQQPKVVEAIIREFERRGVLAVAVVDLNERYEQALRELAPAIVVHTCHSRESVAFRRQLGVPHVHSIFFRKQSIDDWRDSVVGLAASELAFHIVSQELLGAIEPQVGAGTLSGGGSAEAFVPIPDRIEHLVGRAVAWIRLRTKANADKKVAIIYWNREMGKSELMRGSATGMFMNGPRSVVKLLRSMAAHGYAIARLPADEDELIGWLQKWGRQIGVWAPGELDRLARSGKAVLLPVTTYRRWFEQKVPEIRRREVIKHWGEPPGRFMVWENEGKQYLVIPRIDLGNVILLPQPLRGEANDTSLVHDKRVPPPHNYLATYFWLQETFQADAVIHFGTHGTEALLPGKPTGLSGSDWPDIIMGTMPNINPWVINNLGESVVFKRRAYAVLIDHLVPPSVNAGLSDELQNIHNDIDKWMALEEGALKEKFRESITRQVLEQKLDKDLHLDVREGRLLSDEEIKKVLAYLHELHNETIPTTLHVLGQPPDPELRIPYIVICLGRRFLDMLAEVVPVPEEEAATPGDREKFLLRKGAEAVRLVVRQGFSAEEAVRAVGGKPPLSEELKKAFALARQLDEGLASAGQEIDRVLAALEGRFIPPGPGNSPDRNPAVLPTGRNMYVMNPQEVPTRPSWEIGKQLVDELLKQQLETKGHYPRKVAFTLNSFATYQDYGVMEAQILYLLGVRPVWDQRNLVVDLEVIPRSELGRPRIDVFISALGYYRDMLPSRMRLLDKAVRLVAELDEPDNWVREDSLRVQHELEEAGIEKRRAEQLSLARIFGAPPGQYGSATYYYLVERSGEWDTREDLMKVYLSFARYVYTDGLWGEHAPQAYNRHIQGTEILLRSWSDRTRSPLSNKYTWYKGGSLSMAIKYLTGKEPEWFLSDVRDPSRARLVRAEDALRKDFRARLFNRKWIEGMMREGYAGADQIAVHVANTMGWKIMRPGSVSDDIWDEIVEIYIRDKLSLHVREWFEAENPFAYQEITEILLETIRKGYWKPDQKTVREIALEYVQSVVRHGEGAGLRGGGNEKLERFVEKVLSAPGDQATTELLARYRQRRRETTEPVVQAAARQQPQQVRGRKLAEQPSSAGLTVVNRPWSLALVAILLGGALFVWLGYRLRRGTPS